MGMGMVAGLFCTAENELAGGQKSSRAWMQQADPDVLRRNLSPQRGGEGGFERFTRAGGWETGAACWLSASTF